jgi:N-methylhydantoinase A
MSRESLKPGDRLQGPAIIEQPDTTVVVYPNHEATVDEGSNIIVTL